MTETDNIKVNPRDGAQIVRLIRGDLTTRTYADHPTRAARRAYSLAELHGAEPKQERDGSWTVDASDYYANREGA
jgi:hypothetical protein